MPPISPATSKMLDLTKHTVYPRKQDLDYDYSYQILPITAVFAGSERFDLLEITLSTFFKFNTYPIREIYAINDGFTSPDFQAIKNRYPNITWILTNRRVGQINAIDIVYSYIKT